MEVVCVLLSLWVCVFARERETNLATSKLGVETYPSYAHLFKKIHTHTDTHPPTHTHTEDPGAGGW